MGLSETDYTEGYEAGDDCPECDGIVTIRTGWAVDPDDDEPEQEEFQYAQCGSCSWNTFPDTDELEFE